MLNVPLLVFANKQDLELALEAGEVLEALKLTNIQDRSWQIQACSAMSGEGKYFKIITNSGLQDGLSWLIDTISKLKAEQAKK